MNDSKGRFLGLFVAALLLLSSCSRSDNDYGGSTGGEYFAFDTSAEAPEMEKQAMLYGAPPQQEESDSTAIRKKIKNGSIEMKSEDVDLAVNTIENITLDFGGYVESKSVNSGKDYKEAGITVRIPTEHYEAAVTKVSEVGLVLDFYDSVEDVSQAYSDLNAKLEVRRAEEGRLMALIEKSDSMEDIIKLEMRLGEVRTDIRSYENAMGSIDRSVAYSKLHINISQTDSLAIVKPINGGLAGKMGEAFSASAQGLKSFVRVTAIACIHFSMPIIIVVLCTLSGNFVYRRLKRREDGGETDQ